MTYTDAAHLCLHTCSSSLSLGLQLKLPGLAASRSTRSNALRHSSSGHGRQRQACSERVARGGKHACGLRRTRWLVRAQ